MADIDEWDRAASVERRREAQRGETGGRLCGPSIVSRGTRWRRAEGRTEEGGADRSDEARVRFTIDRCGNSECEENEMEAVSELNNAGS